MDFKDLPRWKIVPLTGGLSKERKSRTSKREKEQEKALREILDLLSQIKGGMGDERKDFES